MSVSITPSALSSQVNALLPESSARSTTGPQVSADLLPASWRLCFKVPPAKF